MADLATTTEAPCVHLCGWCGAPTSRPKWCSKKCGHDAEYQRNRLRRLESRRAYEAARRRAKGPKIKPCRNCGQSTTRRVFCSKDCYKEYERKNRKKNLKKGRCKHCGGVCEKYTCASCSAHIRADARRRHKARLRQTESEPYRRFDIFQRDGWICQLCHKPIDPAEDASDLSNPRAATIDHILPISKGGADTPDNVQSAHRGCNCSKHNRDAPSDGYDPFGSVSA